MPFGEAHPNAAAYLTRLMQRPSFALAVKEAEPYLTLVPKETVKRAGTGFSPR
jgi:glutathione S-transferase